MIRILLILVSLFYAFNGAAQSWNLVRKDANISFDAIVVNKPLIIYGEINPADLGVNGPNIGQYGVQGGGIASAFVMLAAHAAAVQGQKSAQVEKLDLESKSFGKVLTDNLNISNSAQFIEEVSLGMPDVRSIRVSSALSNLDSYNGSIIDYRYSVSKDYQSLILDISFKTLAKGSAPFIIQINNNKSASYLNKDGSYNSAFDLKKDVTVLLEEAIRIFIQKDKLILKKANANITFKSLVGKFKRFERGSLISQTCDKHLFLNLSDIWISAPKLDPDNNDVLCSTGINEIQFN